MSTETQSHAVLYQLDGRLFLGPERKTAKCAEMSVSPFEGATVLGVVALLPEPMLGGEFAERRELPLHPVEAEEASNA